MHTRSIWAEPTVLPKINIFRRPRHKTWVQPRTSMHDMQVLTIFFVKLRSACRDLQICITRHPSAAHLNLSFQKAEAKKRKGAIKTLP